MARMASDLQILYPSVLFFGLLLRLGHTRRPRSIARYRIYTPRLGVGSQPRLRGANPQFIWLVKLPGFGKFGERGSEEKFTPTPEQQLQALPSLLTRSSLSRSLSTALLPATVAGQPSTPELLLLLFASGTLLCLVGQSIPRSFRCWLSLYLNGAEAASSS
eukprot:1632380-Pleurochrysis_carterae.AAC.1